MSRASALLRWMGRPSPLRSNSAGYTEEHMAIKSTMEKAMVD